MNDGKAVMRANLKHFIGAGAFVVVLTVIGVLILNTDRLLPPAAAAQAASIDFLFSVEFKLIAFLFALIIGVMVYSIIFFRRKAGDTDDAVYMPGNARLELAWTLIPLGIVIVLALLGSRALAQTTRIDPQAMEVKVIGQQWTWRFEYPAYDIISTELVLPVNKQALLRLSSVDVIHAFWVPEFRVKQDAIPGGERLLRITPTQLGTYTIMCAELCGRDHAYMNAAVIVKSAQEFDAWVIEQTEAVSDDPLVRGQQLAQQYGCLGCHSTDGTVIIGPSFYQLFGKTESLEGGATVQVDDAYLFEAIRDPGKTIVQGFPNLMQPTTSAGLTDEQINDIIAYIKSLK